MTLLEKFLLKALAEYGTYEISGAKHNSRILEYHATTKLKATTDEIAWCSSFVNWAVQGCGLVPTESAAARSWLNWGKAIENPVFGCVVVLDRRSEGNPNAAHVGFFIRELDGNIFVLGGNQGNSVSISVYPKSRVLGYRVPENYV